jgi:hypothetical protein
MAANQCHLRDGQAPFKEATYGFVPQIVKVQIINPRPPLHSFPRQPEGVRCYRE